eukprot:scaffold4851_cov428-Prasinococcus_capsulatus_cf.AAC.2
MAPRGAGWSSWAHLLSLLRPTSRQLKGAKYMAYTASAAIAAYCIYQAVRTDGALRKRWLELWSVADRAQRAAVAGSEAAARLAEDIRDYLNSSADAAVPHSVQQVLRLAASQEVQQGIEDVCGALTTGLFKGCVDTAGKLSLNSVFGTSESRSAAAGDEQGLGSRALFSYMIDRLLSAQGSNFAGTIIAYATRSSLQTLVTVFEQEYPAILPESFRVRAWQAHVVWRFDKTSDTRVLDAGATTCDDWGCAGPAAAEFLYSCFCRDSTECVPGTEQWTKVLQ